MSEINSFYFKPLNHRQREAIELYGEKDVLFLVGSAGAGKSHLAVALALQDVLYGRTGRNRILVTRPIVESGEHLGHLPGSIDEKVAPFMAPIWDVLGRLISSKKDLQATGKFFEPAPLAYLRGRTFTDSVAILDEAQNATERQLKLFLTRLGSNSKIIVTADPSQSDIGRSSGLRSVMAKLQDLPGVGILKFEAEDCVRHPLVVEILKRLA